MEKYRYICKREDGTFEIELHGDPYHVIPEDELFPPLVQTYNSLLPGTALVLQMDGKTYDLMEDHRGAVGWVEGEEVTIDSFGSLPSGWSAEPPMEVQQITEQTQRRAEIMARLAAIDVDSVRPLRAIAKGDASDFDRDKLAALDSEAAGLRAELAGLGAV